MLVGFSFLGGLIPDGGGPGAPGDYDLINTHPARLISGSGAHTEAAPGPTALSPESPARRQRGLGRFISTNCSETAGHQHGPGFGCPAGPQLHNPGASSRAAVPCPGSQRRRPCARAHERVHCWGGSLVCGVYWSPIFQMRELRLGQPMDKHANNVKGQRAARPGYGPPRALAPWDWGSGTRSRCPASHLSCVVAPVPTSLEHLTHRNDGPMGT